MGLTAAAYPAAYLVVNPVVALASAKPAPCAAVGLN